MYIFDTDTLSNIVKSHPSPRLLYKLEDTSPDYQFTTSINTAEIYYGAHRSTHKERILKVFEDMIFLNLTILPFDSHSARIFGELKAKLEKRRIVKSEPDLRIASIALQHRFILVTGNIRNFKGIPRLKIENWIT
jgi:predicted nucleic acid-binding protein